MQYKVL